MVWGISLLYLVYLPAMNMGAMSRDTSAKRVSSHATTWGFLNSTGRWIMGSATFPISLLSSVLMFSAFSSPYCSQYSFSLLATSGSTLVPMRKLLDSTLLMLSAAASANLPMSSKTFSQSGQKSSAGASVPSSSRASLIRRPRSSLVMPVPIFPNMRPRQWSHMPVWARPRILSMLSAIQSSMVIPQRSNPISAILSLGRWLSR